MHAKVKERKKKKEKRQRQEVNVFLNFRHNTPEEMFDRWTVSQSQTAIETRQFGSLVLSTELIK